MANVQFLYGLSYIQKAPPKEWQEIGVNASFDLGVSESSINTNQFTFVDDAAEFIKDWIMNYGVFNGVPFRVKVEGIPTPIFDGYISISPENLEIDSISDPIIYRATLIENTNQPNILDRAGVITQGQLVDENFILNSDFIAIPDIQESKKNIRERAVILGQLLFDAITSIINIIQQIVNAIADTVGLSFPLGLVELVLAFANAILIINQYEQLFLQHKNLFFPDVEYRNGIFLKTVLEKGFQKLGKTVEFGIIENDLNGVALLANQTGVDGWPFPNPPGEGILKPNNFGYTLLECIQLTDFLFNIDFDVIGNVAHIRTQSDPFWNSSPLYDMPDDVQIEITQQYENGNFNNKSIKGLFFGEYAVDESDAHTLTAKIGDSIEVRRTSQNIINEDHFDLKGIENIKIPLALCVRKQPFDNLLDLFTGISVEFDALISSMQGYIDAFQNDIQSGAGVGSYVSTLLGWPPLDALIQDRTGVLKIEDNAFAVPKIVYLTETQIGSSTEYRIPDNFKDIIGWDALYDKWHSWKSPAAQQNFNGQWKQFKNVRIPFAPDDYNKTIIKNFFDFKGNSAKFTQIQYFPDEDAAVVSGEYQEPFDERIVESVIDPNV